MDTSKLQFSLRKLLSADAVFVEYGQICEGVYLFIIMVVKRGVHLVLLRLGYFLVCHISEALFVLSFCGK